LTNSLFKRLAATNDRFVARVRRDGRVVECAGLEIRYTRKRIEGSNPSFSANDFFQYFNPSNAYLQAVDLIEFFSSKAFADHEESHPLTGYSNC
jgi:hypothetical protein